MNTVVVRDSREKEHTVDKFPNRIIGHQSPSEIKGAVVFKAVHGQETDELLMKAD